MSPCRLALSWTARRPCASCFLTPIIFAEWDRPIPRWPPPLAGAASPSLILGRCWIGVSATGANPLPGAVSGRDETRNAFNFRDLVGPRRGEPERGSPRAALRLLFAARMSALSPAFRLPVRMMPPFLVSIMLGCHNPGLPSPDYCCRAWRQRRKERTRTWMPRRPRHESAGLVPA
jgi:hypothetical protein